MTVRFAKVCHMKSRLFALFVDVQTCQRIRHVCVSLVYGWYVTFLLIAEPT